MKNLTNPSTRFRVLIAFVFLGYPLWAGTGYSRFVAPEANVLGNGVSIADGDNTPSLSDYTDFGNVSVCQHRVRTFTIQNTGDAILNISGISASTSKFTIGNIPASVAAGSSATFTVTFSPFATGMENATITINNSDPDEAVYDFAVKANGVATFTQWTQLGSDMDGEAAVDNSGYSISLSGDGSTIVVGARNNDGSGSNAGHARVYRYNGAVWTQLGSDMNGEAPGDLSGYSVAISSDGTRVAVGALLNDGSSADAGQVRVYEYNGSSWIQIGNDIDGESAGDESGRSVSLSADGSIVAIGAIWNDGGGNAAGQVRVYQFVAGNWVQLGSDLDGEAAGDNSGFSVSLSSNGMHVAIGAYLNDGAGTDAGQVRVYHYTAGNWVQSGADINGEAAGDEFGVSVSLSSDGTKLAVGADQNDASGTNAGHARVYQLAGNAWVQTGSDIDGEAAGDEFGYSVSLSSDGTKVAVGGRRNDGTGSNAGHVRVFRLNGSAWVQIASDIDGEAADDETGNSVCLSSDGSIVGMGAQANNGNGTEAGQARVFAISDDCITGKLFWEGDRLTTMTGVNNAAVGLTGDATDVNVTGLPGLFTLSVPFGSNFTVTPAKNLPMPNAINGLTAADASRIQQHVIGTFPFTDLYKMIAADANKNNAITTADASLIQQAVLGNPSAQLYFSLNTWRFVPKAFVFPNPATPWSGMPPYFPETIMLSGGAANQDFIGMKLGDVNSTANPVNAPNGFAPDLVWTVQDRTLEQDLVFTIEFRAENFEDLLALQFGIQFDPSKIQFLKIETIEGSPLQAGNFGLYTVDAGEIRAFLAMAEGKTLPEGTPCFRLKFKVLQGGDTLSEILQLSNSVLPGEAYRSDFTPGLVSLEYESMVSGTSEAGTARFSLLQNRPNPFKGLTVIGFTLPEACEAQIRVFDINGRLVEKRKGWFTGGYNETTLHLDGYSGCGLLYYELSTPYGVLTKKMVLVWD